MQNKSCITYLFHLFFIERISCYHQLFQKGRKDFYLFYMNRSVEIHDVSVYIKINIIKNIYLIHKIVMSLNNQDKNEMIMKKKLNKG